MSVADALAATGVVLFFAMGGALLAAVYLNDERSIDRRVVPALVVTAFVLSALTVVSFIAAAWAGVVA